MLQKVSKVDCVQDRVNLILCQGKSTPDTVSVVIMMISVNLSDKDHGTLYLNLPRQSHTKDFINGCNGCLSWRLCSCIMTDWLVSGLIDHSVLLTLQGNAVI